MKLCKIQYIAQKNDISNCVFLCYHDKKWISGSSRKPCACRWNGVRSPASRSLWCLLGQNKSGPLRAALCLAMTGAEIFSTYLSKIGALFPCGHIRQHGFLFVTAVVWERPRLHKWGCNAHPCLFFKGMVLTVPLTLRRARYKKHYCIRRNRLYDKSTTILQKTEGERAVRFFLPHFILWHAMRF